MKKTMLVMLLMIAGINAALAGENEAAALLYHDALPIWKISAVVDSKGCLWGLADDHGVLVPVRIVAKNKKQFCRDPK